MHIDNAMEAEEMIIVDASDESPYVLRVDEDDDLRRIPSTPLHTVPGCFRLSKPSNRSMNGFRQNVHDPREQQLPFHEWFFP